MPAWIIVLIIITLLVALLLAMRVNVIISYNNSLSVYARVLFIKIPLYPANEKPKKKNKEKKKKKVQNSPEQTTTEKSEKPVSPVKILWKMREALVTVLERFLGYLHFKFIRLKITVACSDAAKTALAYGAATQGVSYILEILNNISNVDIGKRSDIYVKSDFIGQKSSFDGKILLYIRVLPAIKVGIYALKEFFKARALAIKNNQRRKK